MCLNLYKFLFKAYEELGKLVDACQISKRAETIATFALCGFANPGSIGEKIYICTISAILKNIFLKINLYTVLCSLALS